MDREPEFDIFSGSCDKDAVWIESVSGLAKARERMEEIARKASGRYFVFSAQSHAILATTDTSKGAVTGSTRKNAEGAA
jgi:hypothetical protein